MGSVPAQRPRCGGRVGLVDHLFVDHQFNDLLVEYLAEQADGAEPWKVKNTSKALGQQIYMLCKKLRM